MPIRLIGVHLSKLHLKEDSILGKFKDPIKVEEVKTKKVCPHCKEEIELTESRFSVHVS